MYIYIYVYVCRLCPLHPPIYKTSVWGEWSFIGATGKQLVTISGMLPDTSRNVSQQAGPPGEFLSLMPLPHWRVSQNRTQVLCFIWCSTKKHASTQQMPQLNKEHASTQKTFKPSLNKKTRNMRAHTHTQKHTPKTQCHTGHTLARHTRKTHQLSYGHGSKSRTPSEHPNPH